MPEAVIVDAIRTPIGRAFKGSLAQQRPDEMGAHVVGIDPRPAEVVGQQAGDGALAGAAVADEEDRDEG